jgi:NAD(P)H-dependent flavin oxidoreductase YrpB (nitropropane dioxygenase family)
MKTRVSERLGVEFPILAFSHCRDVVAAVTNAGGFGVLGGVVHTPERLEIDLAGIEAETTGRRYGVDLRLSSRYEGSDRGGLDRETVRHLLPPAQQEFVDDILRRYDVPPLPNAGDRDAGGGGALDLMRVSPKGDEPLLDVTFAHRIALIASALGAPPPALIERAHAAGVAVAALAGTVAHAERHQAARVDIIVAQGTEAGGHTGEIATMVLVPDVVDAVSPTPVVGPGRRAPGAAHARPGCAGRRRAAAHRPLGRLDRRRRPAGELLRRPGRRPARPRPARPSGAAGHGQRVRRRPANVSRPRRRAGLSRRGGDTVSA